MRINKYLAASLGVSRRQADEMVAGGRITVNGRTAELGNVVKANDAVMVDGESLAMAKKVYVVLNKPAGYVSSRKGQGAKTIYSLLPDKFNLLKSVGRLDKDSSGVLLLTNDGDFAYQMTHPKFKKLKEYDISLDNPLSGVHKEAIQNGVRLDDGVSRLMLLGGGGKDWKISMSEGRNRQIRRTFAALGYKVIKLHRTRFGSYGLEGLKSGGYKEVLKR